MLSPQTTNVFKPSKSSTPQKHDAVVKPTIVPNVRADEEANGYDEDFESYEDDFEEFSEVSEVKATFSRSATPAKIPKDTRLPAENIVDLNVSHRANSASFLAKNKTRSKRYATLKELIQLDFCVYDLFDLPPLNEYEVFIRSFGSSGSVQSFTQTNNDSATTDCQTEDWYVEDKWTQCPPHTMVESGTDRPVLPWMTAEQDKKSKKDKQIKVDNYSLQKFTEKARTVIESILQEEGEEFLDLDLDNDCKIDKGVPLPLPGSVNGHKVGFIVEIPNNLGSFVACWTTEEQTGIENGAKSILVIWDSKLRRITRYLCCLPTVTVLYIPPQNPNLVFAGTKDGSIQLWDISEPESLHENISANSQWIDVNQRKIYKRWPSFITDNIFGPNYGHASSILQLFQIASSIKETRENQSFQLMSIDLAGVVQSWIVLQYIGRDSGQSLVSNYKMVHGEQHKLLKLQTDKVFQDNYLTACMILSKTNFLVGDSFESIHRISKNANRFHKERIPIRSARMVVANSVNVIIKCPKIDDVFAAGYEDGTLAIFPVKAQGVFLTMNVTSAVVQIEWSPVRLGVLFVLDSQGHVFTFDLLESTSNYTDVFQRSSKITSISLVHNQDKPNRVTLVTGSEDGSMFIHELNSELLQGWDNEDLDVKRILGCVGIENQ